MKNNLIAFGLTLLCVGLTVLLASVLHQFDVIRQVLLSMWVIASSIWIFLSIRDVVKNIK